jgi:iron complex outermembrane recepter protein
MNAGPRLAAALLALCVLAAAGAGAQTAPVPSADAAVAPSVPAEPSDPLAEIVVTAQRRSESKQTTPVSISAFSADTLVANGVESVADLQKLTPGVVLNGAGNTDNTTFTIRGQGKAVIGPGLPSVITYVNEVPLPSWGSSPPTFDINNVQILKGPQGTAFGRNTTGGAVLVYTNQPTNNLGGYAQAQYGDYNDAEFQGALNVPVIDQKLAVRVATDIQRRDGYTLNLTTGRNLDDKHSNAFRVSVLMQPIDALKNVLEADYISYNPHGVGLFPYQYLGPDSVFTGVRAAIDAQNALGTRTVVTTNSPTLHNTYWGVSNTTTLDLGLMTVKNIFGYRNTNVYQSLNFTGLPLVPLPTFLGPLAGLPGVISDSLAVRQDEQFSDELQFSGTALDKHLTWLFGTFYLDDRPSGPDYVILDDFRPVSPYFQVPASLPSPFSSLEDNLYTDLSRSVFLTSSYELAQLSPALKGLKLDGGLRRTWDREGVCANGRSEISFLTGLPLVAPYQSLDECRADPTTYNASKSFQATTYSIALDYEVNDDLFVYFTTRSGYRAGGINSPAMAASLAAFQNYDPQKVKDFEVGLHEKWQLGDWRGRVNIDVFRDHYSALQVQATGILPGNTVGGVVITSKDQPSNTILTFNSGTATVEGVELDGSISPFRGLDLLYGAAYLNPKYDQITVPEVLAPYFAVSKFDGSPRWSYQAAANYVLPFHVRIGGDISVHANFYHIDAQYQQFSLLPAYNLTDFSIQWRQLGDQPLDLTLFVDNAFNKLYIQNVADGQPGLGIYSGSYGPPRLFGARLRYSFGVSTRP